MSEIELNISFKYRVRVSIEAEVSDAKDCVLVVNVFLQCNLNRVVASMFSGIVLVIEMDGVMTLYESCVFV
jgi:hypothetical protein